MLCHNQHQLWTLISVTVMRLLVSLHSDNDNHSAALS